MTNGPPPSEASGSGLFTDQTTEKADFKTPGLLSAPSISSSPNSTHPIPHANYPVWSSTGNYSGYATVTTNPATFGSYYHSENAYSKGNVPPQSKPYNPYSHLFYKKKDSVQEDPHNSPSTGSITPSQGPGLPERSTTPPLPKPETFRYWDEILKRFLEKLKLTDALKGFESDMLVFNSEWEQRMVPDALKDLVNGLQARIRLVIIPTTVVIF